MNVDPSPLLPLRLRPGDDLRGAIEAVLQAHDCAAAFVVAGVGSLGATRLRLAGAGTPLALPGPLEILSLAGSLAPAGAHLHTSIADAQGRVLGGHVEPGCIVRTTAEVLIALLPAWQFERAHDPATGYAELSMRARPAA